MCVCLRPYECDCISVCLLLILMHCSMYVKFHSMLLGWLWREWTSTSVCVCVFVFDQVWVSVLTCSLCVWSSNSIRCIQFNSFPFHSVEFSGFHFIVFIVFILVWVYMSTRWFRVRTEWPKSRSKVKTKENCKKKRS